MTVPLSAGQAALWYADERAGDGPAGHVAHGVEITGPLDVEVFRSCWELLLQRHDALRARFGDEDGVPHQVIASWPDLDFRHEQVAGRPADEVRELLLAEASRPLGLRAGAPLRLRVYSFGAQRHWVLWAVHPIVADARSLAVLVFEFGRLYEAAREGGTAGLEPVDRAYAEALADEEEWRHGPEAERLCGRIADGLRGVPPVEVGAELPGPAGRDPHGAALTRTLPGELVVAARSFCAERGIAPRVLLSTAYQLLLHLRSGQEAIVVGLPATTRPGPGADRLVGCFTNIVPLALDCAGDPTFEELLVRGQEAAEAAMEGRRVPFADVVARAAARRDGTRAPLVRAAFSHLSVRPDDVLSAVAPFVVGAPDAQLRVGDLTLRPLPPVRSVTGFEWELIAVEEPDRLTLSLRYDDGLVRPQTAQVLLDHLTELLGRVLAAPERPVSAHARVTREEALRLAAWNRTERDYEGLPWVHEAFRRQAARTPQAVALRCAGRSVSYRELDRRVTAMTRLLREHGAGPGTVVGVAVERSVELVVSLLGTLAAGAAYLPLDPDYPAERVAFMVEDSGAALVLSQPHLKERLPDLTSPVVWLEDGEPLAGPAGHVESPVGAGTAAYVIYTSGSTGRPKGTLVTHAALRNRIAWMQDQYGLTPDDRVLQKTPSSFDVSVWEFFWPLTQGARLVLARPGGQRDVAYLADVVRTEEITTLHFVPSVLRLFLAEPSAERCPSLRRMFCSGEALPLDLVEAVLDRLPCELHNLYGPTEATVDVTWWPCGAGDDAVPIGFPVANTTIHVLDAAGRALPPGVAGEIHIGGVQLAVGYLNRPRLTAERFVPDPFSGTPGARLYRTGDLGRYRRDGSVEFLGRLDHQVKLHGNRVETGEIEACLAAHPDVRAAVVTVPRRGGAAVLEGHVVPADGRRPDPARLTAHLREHLPPFMIPSRITLLDALPLTPSGKADRKALQAATAVTSGPAARGRRPLGSVRERTVARAVAEVLQTSDIGADDDFFALGAVSSDVLRLRALLARAGLEVTVRDILRHPTVEAVARAVRPLPTEPDPEPFALLTPDDRALVQPGIEDAFPLTGPMRDLVVPPGPRRDRRYQVLLLRFGGEFTESAMRGALDVLAARHSVLRTSFAPRGFTEPLQLVRPRAVVPLRVHDMTSLPPREAQAQADRVVTLVRRERVDFFVRGPLLRADVVVSHDSFALVLGHAGFDRWSTGLLVADLMAVYADLSDGREPDPLAFPPPSGAHLVVMERRQAQDLLVPARGSGPSTGETCLLPRPVRAGDPPGTGRGRGGRASADVSLPDGVRDGLRDLARASGVPLRTVFLTAHLKVVAALCGRLTVTAGVATDCRPWHVAADRFVGSFTRVLPLRVDLDTVTWRELLGRVTQAEREVSELRHAPRPDATTMYDTAFEQVDFAPHEALCRLPGLRLLEWRYPQDPGAMPLTARLCADGATGAPTLVLDSDEDTADARRLAEIADYYARVLAAMAADGPDGRCDVDVRGARERAVADALSTTDVPWRDTGPVGAHLRVAQVAARSPGLTALEQGERRLSHAELDAAVTALTDRLTATGVTPGDVVAVAREPSVDFAVALLAVLRAGAAWLPLDPGPDADPVRRILTGVQVSAVVGDRLRRPAVDTGIPVVPVPPAPGAAASGAASAGPVDPDAVACVVPRAAMGPVPPAAYVSHAALDDALHAVRHRLSWQDTDEVLLVVPSPQLPLVGPELLLALTTGARLVMATAEQARDPWALDELLLACGATTLLAAPDTFEALLDCGWLGDPALRIVCAGAIPPAGLRASLSRAGRVAWSLYGHPETGLWSLSARLGDDRGEAPPGRPLPHVTCHVLGADGRPVAFGVPGELCVGGRGLSRGHRCRTDLDAQSFVTLSGVGGQLYRTGERVRLRPDGVIESLSPDEPDTRSDDSESRTA